MGNSFMDSVNIWYQRNKHRIGGDIRSALWAIEKSKRVFKVTDQTGYVWVALPVERYANWWLGKRCRQFKDEPFRLVVSGNAAASTNSSFSDNIQPIDRQSNSPTQMQRFAFDNVASTKASL